VFDSSVWISEEVSRLSGLLSHQGRRRRRRRIPEASVPVTSSIQETSKSLIMCKTHVYQCPECQHCRSVPFVRPCFSRTLCEWARRTVRSEERIELVDQLCDNRHCMRRHDGGYVACLTMNDSCYFCIRFGSETKCFNRYIPLLCRFCFKERHGSSSSYPFETPHYRTQQRMDKDETLDPRAAARAQVIRDQEAQRQGLLQISASHCLANAAVLAATHK